MFDGRGDRSPVARDAGPVSDDELREMAARHRRIDASSHFGNHSTEAKALVDSIERAIINSGANQDRDTRLKQLVDAFGGPAPIPITRETLERDLVVALEEYCAGLNAISTADGSKVAAWHATERKRRDVEDIVSDIEWLERPRTAL